MSNQQILILRIDEPSKERLRVLAEKNGRTMSNYVLTLIDFAIENQREGNRFLRTDILDKLNIRYPIKP